MGSRVIAVLTQAQAILVSNLTIATAGGPQHPPLPHLYITHPTSPSLTVLFLFDKNTHAQFWQK